MVYIIGNLINKASEYIWNIFLPVIILLGLFIIYKTIKYRKKISYVDNDKWVWSKIRDSVSISLSSKIGTGAIIGILTAMYKSSEDGIGGESIVMWILIGMIILVPITYCDVLFSRVTNKQPREFIDYNINNKAGTIYAICLVILYTFGFVGFQFTGIQSVVKNISENSLGYNFTQTGELLYIVFPLLVVASIIVITKNHELFIKSLSSMIGLVLISYGLFFIVFLIKTASFIPEYLLIIWDDFMSFRMAAIGIPIGLIIGFQRIIQISETALGTSALASSEGFNSSRREALIQTMSTLLTIFIAVIITSYVFTYGKNNVSNIVLSQNNFNRISGYFKSAKIVTGFAGEAIIMIFFIFSGLTTILGSFHFINKTIKLNENNRILLYLSLISLSGLLSVTHFNMIFDITDLLMFIVGTLNITAMFVFTIKNIKKYKK
ncbi:alanine:cation symporter family protein [Clostridiaceae bacterium M8S5]|nr:alanine:cation symporter family protein [Clostridiaceae bacterium M8S5]